MSKSVWAKTWDYVLDFIFPRECVGCGREGFWICPKCQKKIIRLKYLYCPKCKTKTKNGQFCKNCRQDFALKGIIIAAYFQSGPLREAIHIYKYEGVFGELENYLGRLLIKRLKNNLPSGDKVIIPIPLHFKKKIKRGFNQAEHLAKIISREFSLPLETRVLKRKKETDPQVGLKKKSRQKNIEGAFKITSSAKIKNKTVLLVDDVATTGLTLDEAAKILRRAGAKEIWGVVIAQG
jgi:ComF family protein